MFYETFAELCHKKKTTPSAVCLALGMSKSNVTKWKNGAQPKLSVVIAIANYLGVSASKFLPKKGA